MPSKLNDPTYKSAYDTLKQKGERFLKELRKEGKVKDAPVKHTINTDLNRYKVIFPGGEKPDDAVADNPFRTKPRASADSAEYAAKTEEFDRIYGASRGTTYTPGQAPQGQPGKPGQPGQMSNEFETQQQRTYADAVKDLLEQNDPTQEIDRDRNRRIKEAEERKDGEEGEPSEGKEGEGKEGEGKDGKPGDGQSKGQGQKGPTKSEKDASGRPLPEWFTKPVSKNVMQHIKDTAEKVRSRGVSEGQHKHSHTRQWGMGAGSAELTAIGHTAANSTLWEQTVKNFIGSLVKPVAIRSTFMPEARKTSVVNQIRGATGSNVMLWNHNTPNQDKRMFRIFALLDVSSSMFDAQMLSRMKSILMDFKRKDVEFYIFTFDDGITQPVIRNPMDIKTVRGGGGTDFWYSMGSVLKTKGMGWYDVAIVMTDGAFPSIPNDLDLVMRKQGLLKRTMFVLTEDNPSALPSGVKVCRVDGLKVSQLKTK